MSASAIQKIFSQYAQYIDEARFELLSNLFAEDGVLMLEPYGVKAVGPKAIRAKYTEMADPKIKGVHAIFNHIIDVDGQGEGTSAHAAADATYIDITQGQPRLMVLARYNSRFARIGGDWKIKEWNITVKASAFGST